MSWLAADMREVSRMKEPGRRSFFTGGNGGNRGEGLDRDSVPRLPPININGLGQRLLVVATAHRDITVVAADLHLRAFLHAAAVGSHAQVHRGFAAAVADG